MRGEADEHHHSLASNILIERGRERGLRPLAAGAGRRMADLAELRRAQHEKSRLGARLLSDG